MPWEGPITSKASASAAPRRQNHRAQDWRACASRGAAFNINQAVRSHDRFETVGAVRHRPVDGEIIGQPCENQGVSAGRQGEIGCLGPERYALIFAGLAYDFT